MGKVDARNEIILHGLLGALLIVLVAAFCVGKLWHDDSVNIRAKTISESNIEEITVGEDTYQLNTTEDIVYLLPKLPFGNKTQVYSSKTGKPMTVEEFRESHATIIKEN